MASVPCVTSTALPLWSAQVTTLDTLSVMPASDLCHQAGVPYCRAGRCPRIACGTCCLDARARSVYECSCGVRDGMVNVSVPAGARECERERVSAVQADRYPTPSATAAALVGTS